MKRISTLIILGILLLGGQLAAHAAAPASDSASSWPALNYNAAQTNYNPREHTLNASNFLKLQPRKWAPVLLPDASYPVVAGGRIFVPVLNSTGRIHVRSIDASTGKQVALYTKDALGGMLVLKGQLYLAGHVLQAVDVATGTKLLQINPHPAFPGGTFLDPLARGRVIVAGYAGPTAAQQNSLYGIDVKTHRVLWRQPSVDARATIGVGSVFTQTSAGSQSYDESSGRPLTSHIAVYGDWFAGRSLSYTVASVGRGNATLYATDKTGATVFKQAVGPPVVTTDWPHAVGPTSLYIQTLRPRSGVEALDEVSGEVQWVRPIANIQRIALANGVVYVLTYALGQPVRLIGLDANTGKVLGAIVVAPGFYAFNTPNELMVAGGMVLLRLVGPNGSQIVPLGLPS